MFEQPLISRTEHRLLLATFLFSFLLRILNCITSIYFAPPTKSGISFGIYSIFDIEHMMSPVYSFIVFLFCTILAWRINIVGIYFSAFLTLLLTIFFDKWYVDTRWLVAGAAEVNPSYDFKTFDFILINGSFYDVITLLLVNLLLVWQTTIFFRLIFARKHQTFL